jgi:hypothetical protein
VGVLLLVLSILLTACASAPESYPVPPQHDPAPPPARLVQADYVRADDPGADSYFIKDVTALEGTFRWALANPKFRFLLTKTENRSFQIEFAVNPTVLEKAGPLELTILLNEHALATIRHTSVGDKVFRKQVPQSWLLPNTENLVDIRVRNPWTAPDGVQLGFVFRGAGFIE